MDEKLICIGYVPYSVWGTLMQRQAKSGATKWCISGKCRSYFRNCERTRKAKQKSDLTVSCCGAGIGYPTVMARILLFSMTVHDCQYAYLALALIGGATVFAFRARTTFQFYFGGDMATIRKNILKCLKKSDSSENIIEEINTFALQAGKGVFSVLLHVFTHQSFEPRQAEKHWVNVVGNYRRMKRALNRDIDLSVAVCDYFCTTKDIYTFPKIVDIQRFENMVSRAQNDFLTGLPNRRMFDMAIRQAISGARRHKRSLSLLFFDLDSFKQLNDEFGHMAGDKVLQSLSTVLKTHKRFEDVAARYGGEEFLLLLPETGKKEAFRLAERIRQAVEAQTVGYEDKELHITVSCGIATFPDDALDDTSLIKCADAALYSAKRSGKNAVMIYAGERRRFARVGYHEEVKVRDSKGGQSNIHVCKGKDLSCGGLSFQDDSMLDVGSMLEMDLALNAHIFSVEGQVVRVAKLADNRFDVGVSFLEVKGKTKANIGDYVLSSLKHSKMSCRRTQSFFVEGVTQHLNAQ